MGENSRKSIQGKSLESPDPKNILVLHPDLLRSLEPEGINQDGWAVKNILLAVECPAGRVPEANDFGTSYAAISSVGSWLPSSRAAQRPRLMLQAPEHYWRQKVLHGIADHAAERISHWAVRKYFDTVCRNGFEAGGTGTLPRRI
jgi:hypothetical protein